MTGEELRQSRRDDETSDPAWHVDPEATTRSDRSLPEQVLGFFDIGDQPQTAIVEGGAVLGRRDFSRGAVKQAGANPRFELDHRSRYR
ncbi:hypothetical protein D3C80_1309840 [compost metagenome]